MATKRLAILLFVLLGGALLEASSVQKQITQKSGELQNRLQKERQISQKLETLGAQINQQNQKIATLEKSIEETNRVIEKNESAFRDKKHDLESLEARLAEVDQKQKEVEAHLVEVVAQELSYVMMLNRYQAKSAEDLVLEEAFKALGAQMRGRSHELATQRLALQKESQHLNGSILELRRFIHSQEQNRHRLHELKEQHKELALALNKERIEYDAELKRVVEERDSLKGILVQLNITKEQEEERAKRLAQERERERAKSSEKPLEVRQVATAYHDVRTVKYTGERTIPPLERFSIERKFGPYYDPVYKLKVFNESVIFNALDSEAKVRSVMDGKVVFAKETPILQKVVIIEHKNSLHTIYAHLDKIAPTIKPGTPVKKGYIIGRTDRKLMFEVTQKDRHIDPLEFITVK